MEVEESNETFAEFFRVHFERMARLAFVWTGDRSLSDDLAQEAFTRIEPRFGSLDSPLAYTRTVLMNALKEHRRIEARRYRAEVSTVALHLPSAPDDGLAGEIDALPFRQRSVIVLRYYEGLSEAEIAAVLGCRPGTVKSLASRALVRLRRELEHGP